MSKKIKYLAYAIAVVLVAGVMTIAIWAASSGKATISAGVSWNATAGIEFELEANVVNNEAQNGIGTSSTPLAITKQVVTSGTTNSSASGLSGNLNCAFYDSTNDGVNNPNNIKFTYKITNTGDTVILLKATKTPKTATESGTTADNHKPAVALGVKIDGVEKGTVVNYVIGNDGYKIQPGSIFEYIVILSIANADVNITSFDAGVTFSMSLSSGETSLELSRENILYARNGQTVSGTNSAGATTTYTYFGAYPQTYVGDSLNSTLKSALNAGTLEATGESYTTDSAENYYTPNEVTLLEYTYQDEFYACLTSGNPRGISYKFSDGTAIVSGQTYFFKVEPLKWTNHNGNYLCEYSIASMVFDATNRSTLWEESEVRTWLNEVFYEEAGINQVKTSKSTIQNNTINGETTDGAGTPTDDFVWLPSYAEIDLWYGGGNAKNGCSDLVLATYGYYYDSATNWWLRSAYAYDLVYFVDVYGDIPDDYFPDIEFLGVRPVFAL